MPEANYQDLLLADRLAIIPGRILACLSEAILIRAAFLRRFYAKRDATQGFGA
jgi:hypothetical protein